MLFVSEILFSMQVEIMFSLRLIDVFGLFRFMWEVSIMLVKLVIRFCRMNMVILMCVIGRLVSSVVFLLLLMVSMFLLNIVFLSRKLNSVKLMILFQIGYEMLRNDLLFRLKKFFLEIIIVLLLEVMKVRLCMIFIMVSVMISELIWQCVISMLLMSLIRLFVSMLVLMFSIILCVVVMSVDVIMFVNVMMEVMDKFILLRVSMNIIVIEMELIRVMESSRFWML